jgi:hypothetical protein
LKSNKPPSGSLALAASCANRNIRFVIITYFL